MKKYNLLADCMDFEFQYLGLTVRATARSFDGLDATFTIYAVLRPCNPTPKLMGGDYLNDMRDLVKTAYNRNEDSLKEKIRIAILAEHSKRNPTPTPSNG